MLFHFDIFNIKIFSILSWKWFDIVFCTFSTLCPFYLVEFFWKAGPLIFSFKCDICGLKNLILIKKLRLRFNATYLFDILHFACGELKFKTDTFFVLFHRMSLKEHKNSIIRQYQLRRSKWMSTDIYFN